MPRTPLLIACHTHCYGRLGARAAIENVRRAGLEWIELPIRTAGFRSRFDDEPLVTTASSLADLTQVDRLLADHQVRIASCACHAGNPLDPANVATMKRKLDLAAHFGVNVVVGEAGSAETTNDCAQVYDHLREIGDYAGKLGITVCLDTLRGLCVNHREMRQVLLDLDHPWLRINFDTANILQFNENIHGEVALAKICHAVRHVHLKDTAGICGSWSFPALGQGGAVDFLRVYQILRDSGFRGPLGLVVEGSPDEGDLPLEEYHARVVASVTYLRELGYFDHGAP